MKELAVDIDSKDIWPEWTKSEFDENSQEKSGRELRRDGISHWKLLRKSEKDWKLPGCVIEMPLKMNIVATRFNKYPESKSREYMRQ